MERLTAADLERMRVDHADDGYGDCITCCVFSLAWDVGGVEFPCDAARLLDHFAPAPVPHLAGVAYGLLGPSDESELA